MPNPRTIKYLTQDELHRLLKAITKRRDKAIFLIAYRHGLRASEVGMLKVQDVNMDRGRIFVTRGKGSHSGEYPLQPDEVKALNAWRKERRDGTPWLFPTMRGTPISRWTLDYLMKSYGAKASIPPDKRHFHVLKHSIATHLLEAGADLRWVQDWVGHKNIQNTVIYAQITNRAREEGATKYLSSPYIIKL